MTCEVAVINKRGIALAADSAVTLSVGNGEKKKIYYTAEKLFPLAPEIPVAVMAYGPADIMGVPWETVVKTYAQKLKGQRFATLDEYAGDFLAFIQGAEWLFPPETQRRHFESLIREAWSVLYRDELEEKMKERRRWSKSDRLAALVDLIERDHALWRNYQDLDTIPPDYGALVVTAYDAATDQIEKAVFEGLALTPGIRAGLRETVRFLYEKNRIHPRDHSHVVIAGMGEMDPFPVLLEYSVATLAAGTLRYRKDDESRSGGESDAFVIPFAQDDLIHSVINGIHPRVYRQFIEHAVRWTPQGARPRTKKTSVLETWETDLAKEMRETVLDPYSGPFMMAVSALPRQDLARMAEALVNLTAFLMRMTADEDETVAEPIDVALLSKGDGFVWFRHKEVGR